MNVNPSPTKVGSGSRQSGLNGAPTLKVRPFKAAHPRAGAHLSDTPIQKFVYRELNSISGVAASRLRV